MEIQRGEIGDLMIVDCTRNRDLEIAPTRPYTYRDSIGL